MSKEMTPKEALNIIQDNLTPRTLGIFPVEFKIVEQALDRLESLEQEHANALQVIKILTDENKAQEMKKKVGWF